MHRRRPRIEWARFGARTPHYVPSNTLTSAEWPGTRFARGLLNRSPRPQEKQPGKDIYSRRRGANGGERLEAPSTIDELRLLVYPLIAGTGKALSATMDRRRSLAVRNTEQLPDGRVSLGHAISG